MSRKGIHTLIRNRMFKYFCFIFLVIVGIIQCFHKAFKASDVKQDVVVVFEGRFLVFDSFGDLVRFLFGVFVLSSDTVQIRFPLIWFIARRLAKMSREPECHLFSLPACPSGSVERVIFPALPHVLMLLCCSDRWIRPISVENLVGNFAFNGTEPRNVLKQPAGRHTHVSQQQRSFLFLG